MQDKIVIKKIVSLTLAFSFLIMSFTGIMLFIVPQGKIAYWANWKMFGLTKTQYGDIHITSMFLFLIITIWHIYYNWKPLISYIKNSTKKITLLKAELLIALTLNLLFVIGTLTLMQPFKTVLDFNSDIKAYWEREYGSPPFGHAEESSLESFAQNIGVNIEEAQRVLKEKGIVVDTTKQTLHDISNLNNVTPKALYEIIKPKGSTKEKEISSLGRRSLQELSDMQKIDLQKALLFLKTEGFEATPQSKIREAADTLNLTPSKLLEELQAL